MPNPAAQLAMATGERTVLEGQLGAASMFSGFLVSQP
jgi:hypothetical protein